MLFDILGVFLCLFFACYIYLKFGSGYVVFHPVNILLITVLFEFVVKYFWIASGQSLDPVGLDYYPAIYFIALFLFFFCVISKYFLGSTRSATTSCKISRKEISVRVAVVLICLALSLNFSCALLFGGSPFYGLSNPIEFRIFMQKGGMFYIEFLVFFLVISSLAIVARHAVINAKLLSLVFLFVYVASLFIALNSGLRGRFLELMVLPIVVYCCVNKKTPTKLLASLGVVFIPFAVLFGMYRDAVRYNSLSFDQAVSFLSGALENFGTTFLPLFMHRFDAFDNFVRVLHSGGGGFLYGQSLIGLLAQPVPRSLWPSKPNNFTSEMSMLFRPDLYNDGIALTFSGFAEAYLNFGFVLGAFIFAGFMVLAVYFLQRLLLRAAYHQKSIIIFCLLYQYPFISISAGFINDVSTVFVILSLLLTKILYVFFGRVERSELTGTIIARSVAPR